MDFEKLLSSLVVALAINELVHIALETWGIRSKVRMFGQPILWHGLLFVIVTGISFGVFLVLDLAIQAQLYIAIFLMIVAYAYTTIAMDEYHTQIGKILRKTKTK